MVCSLRNILSCETKYTSHITSATGDTQRRKVSPSSMFAGPKSLGLLLSDSLDKGLRQATGGCTMMLATSVPVETKSHIVQLNCMDIDVTQITHSELNKY